MPATTCLTGCKDHARINALHARRDSVATAIHVLTAQTAEKNHLIDSLESARNTLDMYCRTLMDSTDLVIQDNQMAATCIFTFDRNPIDIVTECFQEMADEERAYRLPAKLLLLYYQHEHEAEIEHVRQTFNRLDQKKREALVILRNINQQLIQYRRAVDDNTEKNSQLKKLQEDVEEALTR